MRDEAVGFITRTGIRAGAARRQRAVAWLLLLVAAAGVIGTVVFTVDLERRARASMSSALAMKTLEANSLELSRSEDAALLGGPDVVGSLVAAQATFAAEVGQATRRLSAADMSMIGSAAHAYSAAVSEVTALLSAGNRAAAIQLDQTSENAAFEDLHSRVEVIAKVRRARGQRDERSADVGTLVALVCGGLLVSGVIAVGLGLRSRVDRMDGEQSSLRRSEATFKTLVYESNDILMVTDAAGIVASIGPSTQALLGYEPRELVGRALADLVHPDDQAPLAGLLARRHHPAVDTVPTRVEWQWRHADGSWRWFEASVRDLTDHRDVGGWVFNARDVTERRRLEAELRDHALHDPLTGLANRTLFDDRLARALATRSPQRPTLLAVDLDGFKQINDTHGHAIGDRLLVVVADRLRGAVRPVDTVARLGGDEFAVLVEGVADSVEADRLAARIVEAVGEPVDADGEPLLVGASVGIAQSSEAADASALTREADAALYAAKHAGGRTWRRYQPERDFATVDRRQLHNELRAALRHQELVLHYQPIVDLSTGELAGVEALLRWNRPRHGLVPPDVFIPLAERTGEIIPIGRWVLEEAVATVRAWQVSHPAHLGMYVSVNLSARQLHDPRFVDHTRNVLAETGLAPANLILELTETVLAVDTDQVAERLNELKTLGVQLAVDDFGTGYSSLSYLRRFPIDIVKIDRSFVKGSEADPQSAALLAGVVTLGESLQLRTLAEGVETDQQAETLRHLHCQLAQGFHFSRPLPATGMDLLLSRSDIQPDSKSPPIFQ